MRKIVIVINGKGGAGKDTVCDIVSRHYNAVSVSSITPIKEIASQYGWNGEKDNRARRFLADLKKAFSDYNDLPTAYLMDRYSDFMADANKEIMFAHIREASEISHFAEIIPTPLITLYIDRPGLGRFDNDSDDNAAMYEYDYTYQNVKPLDMLERDFIEFFGNMLKRSESAS